jgi:hypothetical protein
MIALVNLILISTPVANSAMHLVPQVVEGLEFAIHAMAHPTVTFAMIGSVLTVLITQMDLVLQQNVPQPRKLKVQVHVLAP